MLHLLYFPLKCVMCHQNEDDFTNFYFNARLLYFRGYEQLWRVVNTSGVNFQISHRLDVEGLMHGFHWVTMAELGGRGAGRAIVQHQRPGGNIS